jgi:hypothetical protein
MGAGADLSLLELGEHGDLAALERSLQAVGETNAVGMFVIRRRFHNDAYCSARMENQAGRTGNVHQGHDLRAHGENQVGRIMHSVSHDGYCFPPYKRYIIGSRRFAEAL